MHRAAVAEHVEAVAKIALPTRLEGAGVVEAIVLFGEIDAADNKSLVDDLRRAAFGVDGETRHCRKRAGVDDGDVIAVGHGVDAGKVAFWPDIAADHRAAILDGDGAVFTVRMGIDAVIGRVDRAGGQNAYRAPIASEVLPGARIDAVLAGDDVPVVSDGDRTVVALRIGAGRAGNAVDPCV